MPRYSVRRNEHGVPHHAGPRVAGPHKYVWDFWPEVTSETTRIPGPAQCQCWDCGAEWSEGGQYPAECSGP